MTRPRIQHWCAECGQPVWLRFIPAEPGRLDGPGWWWRACDQGCTTYAVDGPHEGEPPAPPEGTTSSYGATDTWPSEPSRPPCRNCGHAAVLHEHWTVPGDTRCAMHRCHCPTYLGPTLLTRLIGWLSGRGPVHRS